MNYIDNDNIPLYQNKSYRRGLELINENVPLAVVKRRWHNALTVNKCNEQHKKLQYRNAIVINAQLVTTQNKCSKVSFSSHTKQ